MELGGPEVGRGCGGRGIIHGFELLEKLGFHEWGFDYVLLDSPPAGGLIGWGECEASPLVLIAAFVAPMSHGACRPVSASVLGRRLDGPDDIRAMAADVAYNSMDLLQAAHTWSGVEMALWDLLGKARGEPAWRLLGQERAFAAAKGIPLATVRGFLAGHRPLLAKRWKLISSPLQLADESEQLDP